MDCACHGEPCYWQKDPTRRGGGRWICAVRRRERSREDYAKEQARERKLAHQRDRYDADPFYRIEKQLHDNARKRADTLKRKREALYGEVSPEGRR